MLEAGRTGAHTGTKESIRQHVVGEGYSFPSSDVEQLAREQEAREATEQAPTTTKQLIDATESAVDTLVSILARNSEALDHLYALQERVLFYLQRDGEPTPFVQALLTPEQERTVDEISVVHEISKVIVSELNPILYQLHQAIILYNQATQAGESADVLLGEEEGLLAALRVGKYENQTTTTLFGFLEGLSAAQEHVPQRFYLLDPLSQAQENVGYWAMHQRAHEAVTQEKEVDYARLIAGRTERALYEVDQFIESRERAGADEEEIEQYEVFTQFLDAMNGQLQEAFTKTVENASAFRGAGIGLNGVEVIELLSAAETLKTHAPFLYARLLGIAPGRKNMRVERSDLFGNAFHLFLQQSLHDKKRPQTIQEIRGHKVIKDYLQGLTEKDTRQVPLAFVSDEQLEDMQSSLKRELEKEQAEQNPFLLVSLITSLGPGSAAKEARDFLDGVAKGGEEVGESEMEIRLKVREQMRVEKLITAVQEIGSQAEYEQTEKEIRHQIFRIRAARGEITSISHEVLRTYFKVGTALTSQELTFAGTLYVEDVLPHLEEEQFIESVNDMLEYFSDKQYGKVILPVLARAQEIGGAALVDELLTRQNDRIRKAVSTEGFSYQMRTELAEQVFAQALLFVCVDPSHAQRHLALAQHLAYERMSIGWETRYVEVLAKGGELEQAFDYFVQTAKEGSIGLKTRQTLLPYALNAGRFKMARVIIGQQKTDEQARMYAAYIGAKKKAGLDVQKEIEKFARYYGDTVSLASHAYLETVLYGKVRDVENKYRKKIGKLVYAQRQTNTVLFEAEHKGKMWMKAFEQDQNYRKAVDNFEAHLERVDSPGMALLDLAEIGGYVAKQESNFSSFLINTRRVINAVIESTNETDLNDFLRRIIGSVPGHESFVSEKRALQELVLYAQEQLIAKGDVYAAGLMIQNIRETEFAHKAVLNVLRAKIEERSTQNFIAYEDRYLKDYPELREEKAYQEIIAEFVEIQLLETVHNDASLEEYSQWARMRIKEEELKTRVQKTVFLQALKHSRTTVHAYQSPFLVGAFDSVFTRGSTQDKHDLVYALFQSCHRDKLEFGPIYHFFTDGMKLLEKYHADTVEAALWAQVFADAYRVDAKLQKEALEKLEQLHHKHLATTAGQQITELLACAYASVGKVGRMSGVQKAKRLLDEEQKRIEEMPSSGEQEAAMDWIEWARVHVARIVAEREINGEVKSLINAI